MGNFAKAPASPPRRAAQARLAASSALAGSLALMLASSAYALPTAGVVAAGQATIAAAPGALTIHQSSQNAVLNWQSFSIGQGEAVTFVQPDAHAVALNRVLGPDPSAILGRLSANGRVFLVNPNGVLFGSGAQVNVGGLVASTLQIQDADFMVGRYRFSSPGPGSVVNRGSIRASFPRSSGRCPWPPEAP
jgi:filamentous hemagglutinin family protein